MQVYSLQLFARGKMAVLAKQWHENERYDNWRAHYIDIEINKLLLQSPVLSFHKLRAVSYFSLCLQSSWVLSKIRTVQILREKGDSKQPIFFFLSRINSLNSHYILCLSLEFEMADHDNKQKRFAYKIIMLNFLL